MKIRDDLKSYTSSDGFENDKLRPHQMTRNIIYNNKSFFKFIKAFQE